MILQSLAVVLMLSAGQTAPSGGRESAPQGAPVRTVADAVALLKANGSGPQPAVSPGHWVTNDDYPAEAIRRGEQGVVGFALEVDSAGRVSGCSITASSGSRVLDETTGQLMRTRASFEPARDARGKAIAGRWSSRFRWEMPASPPPWNMEKPVAAHLTFDVAPDGKVSNCTLEAEGTPAPPRPLCSSLEKIPAPLLDYLRGGTKAPVTIAADFTLALQGAAPLPVHPLRPGVVTFAHLNFDAEPAPAGRPHCAVKGAWGDYKGSMEFPCPREMQKAFGGKAQILRMVMTLGSSGPAPDPEGLGPIIKLLKAKNRPEPSDEIVPANPETHPAPPAAGSKAPPPPVPTPGSTS